ncbi:MAG: hypothetical protein EBQ92_07000 [Proteobacteria bacterium]|nr:hypothetical protein [Pseudomonadota bacterium]
MLVKLPFLLWFLCISTSYAEHLVPSTSAAVRAKESHSVQASAIPASDSFYLLQNILLGKIDSLEVGREKIISLVETLSKEERQTLIEQAEKKIPLITQDFSYSDGFYFSYTALLQWSAIKDRSIPELEHLRKVIQHCLEDDQVPHEKKDEYRPLLELIRFTMNQKRKVPTSLKAAQAFPESQKTEWFLAPENFKHPSGAIQIGRVEFERPDGKGFSYRIPISPGTSSGAQVLRISLHGDGDEPNYALSNRHTDEISVGYYGDLLRQKEKPNLANLQRHIPKGLNPVEIISESCNPNPDGACPATYAKWLQVERFGEPTALQLKKVVMTPKGFSSVGILDARVSRLFGDQGSFGQPYYREWVQKTFDSSDASPREYRLVRGGNPEEKDHWIDTGIYTDSRQSHFPLVGILGEAKEYGRHLGLSPELGGGDSVSYLDKIRLINNNPDATYFQKVRSNLARPVGSSLALIRETVGLSYDLYRWAFY